MATINLIVFSEDKISKLLKIAFYSLVVCSFLSVLVFAQAVFTQQLQAWNIAPQPQRFSQLYFTNYRQLPASLRAGTKQKMAFTIRNLEHHKTNYHYELVASAMNGGESKLLESGELTLEHGKAQSIDQTITVPRLDVRVMVQVKVSYEGVTFGEHTPSLQTQSIHHWVTFADFQAGQKGAS